MKISDLANYSTPTNNDELPIIDVINNTTKKVTRQNLFKNPPLEADSITPTMLSVGVPVQMASVEYNAVATGTTVIPKDNTIPQNTEGDQYMTLSYTPKSATNILMIEVVAELSSSIATWLIAALFKDSVADALSANGVYQATPTGGAVVTTKKRMVAGVTTAISFKVRCGGAGAGTTTFNGDAGTRLFGDIPKSSIVITEYKAA